MRRALVVGALSAAMVAGVVTRAPVAWACSCIAATTAELFAGATFVFSGTVTSVETISEPGEEFAGEVRAGVSLDEIFKGRLPATIDVSTASDEATCGIAFVAGMRYTIFGTLQDGGMRTGLCSGTTDDPAVRAAVADLAAGTATIETTARPAGDDGGSDGRAGAVAAAVILLALAGGALGYRLRRAGG